jgi:hypothetical protein
MQFFLLDFALAFVALLGYRAAAAVAARAPTVAVTPGAPGRAGASGRDPF